MKHFLGSLSILLLVTGCGTVAPPQPDAPVVSDTAVEVSVGSDMAPDVVIETPDASDTQASQEDSQPDASTADVDVATVTADASDDASDTVAVPDVPAVADVVVADAQPDVPIVVVDVPVVCGAGMTNCGGTCVNLNTNQDNCGICGNACTYTCGAVTPGFCVCPGHMAPEFVAVCSGVCTDLLNDRNNCGGCGHVCPSGQSCVFTTCR